MLIQSAAKYLANGLSVIATDNNKRSIFSWKKYQAAQITEQELAEQLRHPKAAGLAIICGGVSGGLEVIDVDCKYALTPDYFDTLRAAIEKEIPALYGRLLIIRTRSNGYHIYYRCEVIEGNQKLAMRLPTNAEHKDNPQVKHVTLIETRGEGGYVIAPPTDGYVNVQGKAIPVISIDEREALLSVCRSFNDYFETPEKPATPSVGTATFGLSPFEDYNKRGDIVELLIKHGWTQVHDNGEKIIFKRPGNTESKSSGDYNRRLGWFSVFTTNSIFTPNKAYQPYAVFAMLEAGGDYKRAARMLIEMGFGEKVAKFGDKLERELWKRKTDGVSVESLVNYIVQTEKKTDEEASDMLSQLEKKWGKTIATFWNVTPRGVIEINRTRLGRFLCEEGGFYIYKYDSTSTIYKIVRCKEGFVEEASTQQMKQYIKKYIESLPDTFDGGITPDDLNEVILKGAGIYFSDAVFEFFNEIKPDFLRSTPQVNYFPFMNGVVCIDKKEVTLKSYGELGKTVWRSRVIPFNIQIDQDYDPELCEYYKFINCISGDEEKLKYAMLIIGYLLHTYKDASRPYAVILAEETDNDKDGGGTGKGIFVKALSYLLRTVKLDGKNFKIDKTFALQRVSLDTQLISIEDCDKNLDFEKFNSQITEGSVVEKKNKDELFIDYKDSPKFVFSTNYMLNLKGNHGKRRSRVFEFTPFFSPSYTPVDYFGKLLFDDWEEDEWNRFYNFMFLCVSLYLQHGISQPPASQKLRKKQIKVNFTEEFLDYFLNIAPDQWHGFTPEYKNFLTVNDWEKKEYSSKRFKKALVDSSELLGIKIDFKENRQNNNLKEFKVDHVGLKQPIL